MSRLPCLAALAVTAVLLVPAGAAAKIRVNHSIAGVRPGMDERAVRDRLGQPTRAERRETGTVYHYERRKLAVTFLFGEVLLVQTASRRERTGSGVGVGSSRARVRSRVRGVRCGAGAFAQCVTRGSGRLTVFQLKDGRVAAVSLQDA